MMVANVKAGQYDLAWKKGNEMKFQIETKKLNDILKAVATATPKKTRISGLQWIRIDAKYESVEFFATDLKIFFRIGASACVMTQGSALVEASQILKLAKAVKTDHVWIELDSDSGKLKIGPSFSLNTCNPDDYPDLNQETQGSATTVSSQDLKRLIDDVKHCACKYPHSPQGYMGILLKSQDQSIISAAQDGWRLAESRIVTDAGQEQWQKLFPEDQVKFLLNALPKKNCQIEVRNTEDRLYLSWLDGNDHFEIAIFADSENGFLDYDGFFPEEFETQAWAPKKDLLESVKTVSVVATEQPKEKNAPVSYRLFFEAKSGNLSLSAESCGMQAQELIKIDGNSDFGVGLNCVFLEEMVKAIDSELVAFSCSGPEMPVYMWPDNQYTQRRQVVMSLTMR